MAAGSPPTITRASYSLSVTKEFAAARDSGAALQQSHPDGCGPLRSPKMVFSNLYKNPKSTFSKLRGSHQSPPNAQPTDFHPDLLSKDKARQKEAVKVHLAARIRNDWAFTWPPAPVSPTPPDQVETGESTESAGSLGNTSTQVPEERRSAEAETVIIPPGSSLAKAGGSGAEVDSETESIYSVVSEDQTQYRPRAEWTSELSEEERAGATFSPFRYDTPDAIGLVVKATAAARKAKRRRETRAEAEWNAGLACFTARRDAWTGARTAKVKPKIASPSSPTSPRSRGLFRFHSHTKSDTSPPTTPPPVGAVIPIASAASPLSPITSTSRHSDHSAADTTTPPTSDGDSHKSAKEQPHPEYPVETLLPLAPPLLPPGNPMRASVGPAIYLSLYDKVVVNSLQPSCPINLADMTRSCVAGWQRDGEWPPRGMALQTAEVGSGALVVVRKKKKEEPAAGRRLSFGALMLGRDGGHDNGNSQDDTGAGKGIRRSIQRVLFGHSHSSSVGSAGGAGPKSPTKDEERPPPA
jgi:hypothetical protein